MRIYIAGPYSKGDVAENVRNAIYEANYISFLGHEYYLPHTSHFEHMLIPRPYEFWLKHDMAWLELCDALFRMEGESNGADKEVARMIELGRPIFYKLFDIPKAEK
jgi:hypothetical protein